MRPIRLRRDLRRASPTVAWPAGVRPAPFTAARAGEVHALLAAAYAGGEGEVPAYDAWWAALSSDSEYDPALIFLAEDSAGHLLGVAHCWTGAFVKDLAVAAEARGLGVGRALMTEAFAAFRARGATALDLKVRSDNPRALRFYRALGLRPA